MIRTIFLSLILLIGVAGWAQTQQSSNVPQQSANASQQSVTALQQSANESHQNATKESLATARSYSQYGDFDNAIIVLSRALRNEPENMDLQKDIAMNYFLKRDYAKAKEFTTRLTDRTDADVVCFQLAGNIYKALAETKDCEKIYKKGLKKFPQSGPLYSEFGELLWEEKDATAIEQWELGIKKDPSYSGNYYNAALFYFYTTDKIWSTIYAEIFVNMESRSERGEAMRKLLWQSYKEKLLNNPDLMKGEEKNKNEFEKAYLTTLNNHTSLADKGINIESITMIRTRFILDWFTKYAEKFPFKLFDYQQQLLKSGLFNAYNQWLFGDADNHTSFENWVKINNEEYLKFIQLQQNRIFKMPEGQHYQSR